MPSAGEPILAADFPAGVSSTEDTSGTTTSTTFTPTLTGGTACGLTFVAPTSGKVLILNNSRMVNSGANDTYCGFVLRTGAVVGSGTTVVSAADNRAALHNATVTDRRDASYLASGLTAGATYNVQQEFRVSAGTGTYANKHLIVTPTT
jgi:hypothetical protein